ncbi:sugar phosphate nucleotidyltransferase [Clostridium sp. MB40-C1]|nr:sugar phosphate nucleotidyltransferase [Clostridium sp. MB40-C1]WMJ79778.1 sugar phosphate nucleotidyltransferase [Clostridium sp. MB40-C1]
MVILNCENAALKVTYIVYKETATCIGLSAVKLLKRDKDAVMLVLPSDHYIQNNKKFIDTISQAIQIAERRRGLVTIGVNPTRPETGYGYIQIGDRVGGDIPTYKVERFTEKPNLEVAKDFLVDGSYLWNSGMFVWRADVFLREMEKYLPKMYKNLMEIYKDVGSEKEEETISTQYNLIEGISVDFGVMQKTRKAYTIKCEFIWDDIGSFSSMTRFLNEFRGNNVLGKTFLEESEDCFVFSKEKLIIGFGIKDLIIVDAGDVLLVMDKNKDQELKHLVNKIKEEKEYNEYL